MVLKRQHPPGEDRRVSLLVVSLREEEEADLFAIAGEEVGVG